MTTFATVFQQVESLYLGYFGRSGDPMGMSYWANLVTTGTLTLGQVAASYSVQVESTAKYAYLANPSIGDPGAFVDQVYQNMFNHVADAAGKAYWMQQLTEAGGKPDVVGRMILNIISGAPAGSADNATIINKVDVGADFTTKVTNFGITWTAIAQAQSAAGIAATDSTSESVTAAKLATDAYLATVPHALVSQGDDATAFDAAENTSDVVVIGVNQALIAADLI
jgi:hypothetical protein